VHYQEVSLARPDVKLISLGVGDLYLKSNYQNFSRYIPVDVSIAGDAETTLPALIEEVRQAMPNRRRAQIAEREPGLRQAYSEMRERSRQEATYAWNASPVRTARLCMELWEQIKGRDWSLVSETIFQSQWPQRLWKMDKHHQLIGGSGGFGVGYGAPAAVGAALANREKGILSVNIQSDGDMLYAPGVFWTAAHHGIPLLSVMHNNRAYHQEVMHIQRMGLRRQRGVDGPAKIGNTFEDPFIDFAAMANSMGVWSSGPIEAPGELAPALRRALDVVEQGEPALVDVICQPR
jgi:thiamine pyrophosphate-dependent acetolactate synthase large subunit-like protein